MLKPKDCLSRLFQLLAVLLALSSAAFALEDKAEPKSGGASGKVTPEPKDTPEEKLDPAIRAQVENARMVFTAARVILYEQDADQKAAGFTRGRFFCNKPLKGEFSWLGPQLSVDIALAGFACAKRSDFPGEQLAPQRKEFLVMVGPPPAGVKEPGNYGVAGWLEVKGSTATDIKTALMPADEKLAKAIRALLESKPLEPDVAVVQAVLTRGWAGGPAWQLEIKNAGGVTYKEYGEKATEESDEMPPETMSLSGALSAEETAAFIELLENCALPELQAEDAGEISFTFRKPGLAVSRSVSAIGLGQDEPNLAGEIFKRVTEIKRKLKETK